MATLQSGFISSNNAAPGPSPCSKQTLKCSRNSLNVIPRVYFSAISVQNRSRGQVAWIARSADRNDVGANISVAGSFPFLNLSSVFSCRQVNAQVVTLNAFRINGLFGNKLAAFCVKNVKCADNDRKVFNDISERGLPEYAALIRAYCQSEKWNELFVVFRSMVDEGLLPHKYLVPTILKACSRRQMVKTGKMVHGYVLRNSLVSDTFIGNALMDFYSNCGALRFSIRVFDSMSEKDVVSWTALVSAYVEEGLLEKATEVFQSMQSSGLEPDLISWNALVAGFARHGEIDAALQHLKAMQEKGLSPRVNSWNGIISGCVQNGYFEDALDVFYNMLAFPEKPNSVTVSSILPACAGLKDIDLGRAIHGYALKCEFYTNIYVEGSLVDMYSKCGLEDYAKKVFARADKKNVALWNEIIAAYVNQGKTSKALSHFRSMQNRGLKPDVITYNTLLAGHARKGGNFEAYKLFSEMSQKDIKPNVVSFNALISGFQQSGLSYESLNVFQAMLRNNCFRNKEIISPTSVTISAAMAACADLNLLHEGKEIHGYMLRAGFEDNYFTSSALIDMYIKCDNIDSAMRVFRRIENRNEVCWNALIAGYVKILQLKVAIELFCEMLVQGIKPSSVTFSILVSAISERAYLTVGRQLHSLVIKSRLLASNNNLANALSCMYTMNGCSEDAEIVDNIAVTNLLGGI